MKGESIKPIRLNIGAGQTKKAGFISVDGFNQKADIVAPADSTGFVNNSVDEIYSSHMVEHIDRADLNKVFKHWYNILKTGGTITVLVPNARIYLAEWLKAEKLGDFEHLEGWGTRWIMGFEGKGTGMYHTNLFCIKTLERLLEINDFTVIKCVECETRVTKKDHFEYRPNGDLICLAKK